MEPLCRLRQLANTTMVSSRYVARRALIAALVLILLIGWKEVWLPNLLGEAERNAHTGHEQDHTIPIDRKDHLEGATAEKDTSSNGTLAMPIDPSEAPDKVIVMAKLQHEDTKWVHEYLPNWQNAIYTVDNTSAPLSTPHNKGRESNAYLLYIIQNYHNLPSTLVFLHPHRDGYPAGWHTDVAGFDNVLAVQSLNLDFVQRNGYVNMRCNWNPGCPDEIKPLRALETDDPKNVERYMSGVWQDFFGGEIAVPEAIATPCCAQFAVSREQVLKRPLEDYQKYHQWLMDTPLSDTASGRVLEYLWHVIFGKDAV